MMEQFPVPREKTPALPAQADSDEQVIALWLHGRSPHTQRAYAADVASFGSFVEKPLFQVALGDLQAFADSLERLSPASRARRLNAVKSLLGFAQRIGYLAFNVAAPVRTPTVKDVRAERILSEAQVQRMLALEPSSRNHALLRLLYAAGMRVSEACALQWKDAQERGEAGQVAVYGKGGKTRVVLLSADTWRKLVALRGEAEAEDPVFPSRKRGGPLDPSQVLRIVRSAAKRAGIEAEVSPHWLRHAHASHALERGAPIHLVQVTLGHASVATTGRYLHARPSDSSARYLAV